MRGVLRSESLEIFAVKAYNIEIEIKRVVAVFVVIAHKIDFFILFIHILQLLDDKLFFGDYVHKLVAADITAIKMGIIVLFAPPEKFCHVLSDKVRKAVPAETVRHTGCAEIQESFGFFAKQQLCRAVVCVYQVISAL